MKSITIGDACEVLNGYAFKSKEFIENLANEKFVYDVRCLGKRFYEGNVVTEWYVEFNNEGCVMLFEK